MILHCVQEETKQFLDHIPIKANIIPVENIITARKEILNIHISEALEQYIIHLIMATRDPKKYLASNISNYIQYGASPRATIALARTARALAWLDKRDYVIPEDIKIMAPDVLRHRIILTYIAEAEHISKDDCINEILNKITIP